MSGATKFKPGDVVIWTDGKPAEVVDYASEQSRIVRLKDDTGLEFTAGESELRFPDVKTVNGREARTLLISRGLIPPNEVESLNDWEGRSEQG